MWGVHHCRRRAPAPSRRPLGGHSALVPVGEGHLVSRETWDVTSSIYLGGPPPPAPLIHALVQLLG